MVKIKRTFLVLFTLITYSPLLFADSLSLTLEKKLQNYLTQNKSIGVSAIQLSILLPGEIEPRDYSVGTQFFNTPTSQTNTRMLLQWGSITKEYTNVLLFQLIKNGTQINNHPLQTTNTLEQLFPEAFTKQDSSTWPTSWRKITLNQLMNMTSGIPDYTSIPQFTVPSATPPLHYTLEQIVDITANYQTKIGCVKLHNAGCFQPAGSTYFYSNTNYIILGMVIAKATRKPFEVVMNKFLQTYQDPKNPIYYYPSIYPKPILAQMIHGYYYPVEAKQPIDVTNYDMSLAASAGALTGNMHALVEMTYKLYKDQFIPISLLQQDAVQFSNGQSVTNAKIQCLPSHPCYARGLLEINIPTLGLSWLYEGGTYGYLTTYLAIPFPHQQNLIVALSVNNGGSGRATNLNTTKEAVQIALLINQYLKKHPTP